jgi:hypothetical protein
MDTTFDVHQTELGTLLVRIDSQAGKVFRALWAYPRRRLKLRNRTSWNVPTMAKLTQSNSHYALAQGTLNVRATGSMNDRVILSVQHSDGHGQLTKYSLHLTTQDARELRDYLIQQKL